MEKLTKQLKSLKKNEEFIQWIEEHKGEEKTFSQYFQELCEKYHTNPSKLSTQCSKSKSYLYKCKSGEKIPTKRTIVCIGFALKATQEEINQMLMYAGHKELYAKNIWDAVIIFGLHNGYTSYEVDRLMMKHEIKGGLLNEEERKK